MLLGVGEPEVQDWDGDRLALLSPVNASRILESVRVYRTSTKAWIISSGGPVSARAGAPTSAGLMKDELLQLGVPAAQILLEARSLTTHDEAVLVAPMLRDLHPDRVVVVTSEIHMWRALGAFRASGVEATPAIARDPYLPFNGSEWLLPTAQGLKLTRGVVHEAVGVGYYFARGWWR